MKPIFGGMEGGGTKFVCAVGTGPNDLRAEVGFSTTTPCIGYILPTSKPGWTNADVVGSLQSALNIPIAFDTDVNAAAPVEWRWGAGQGCDPILYLCTGYLTHPSAF
jgi:fructokinase